MVMYVKEFLKNKNKQNKIQIQGKTEPKRWLFLFRVESILSMNWSTANRIIWLLFIKVILQLFDLTIQKGQYKIVL